MAGVKRWWLTWGGHVYTAGAIILIGVTVWCVWIVVSSVDSYVMFYAFVIGMLSFLIAICLGILGSHKLQTRIQRRYITRTDETLEALEPPGRDEKAKGSRYPFPRKSRVSDAHSASQEDLRGR